MIFLSRFPRAKGGNRQSAGRAYRPLPPYVELIAYDYVTRSAWALVNNHFDVQARASLASLRPSSAWISNVGMRRAGEFRAIYTTAHIPGTPMTITPDVEARWGPPFFNITTRRDRPRLLYSFRPPGGSSGWVRSNQGPPNTTFLNSDGSSPNAVRGNPTETNQARVEEPVSSSNQTPVDRPTTEEPAI